MAKDMVEIRLRDFELSFSEIIGCTTDGAAVMVKFGKLIPSYHQLCYNHGIHLSILDVLYKKSVEYLPQSYFDVSSLMTHQIQNYLMKVHIMNSTAFRYQIWIMTLILF